MNANVAAAVSSSFLIWVLAAVSAVMTAAVALGWIRQAQLHPGLRQNWRSALLVAAVLGLGFSTVVLLAITAQGLPYAVGYSWVQAPVLLLASMVVCWPVTALLGWRPNWAVLILSGLLLGLFMLGLSAAWVMTAGFRPGIKWRMDSTLMATGVAVGGMLVALFVSFTEARSSHTRTAWRWAGALLMGITAIGTHQILMSGANLALQVGSAHDQELPGTVLCLVLGVLVPMIWSLLLLDLRLRRQEQKRLERRDKRYKRHRELYGRDSVSYATKPEPDPPLMPTVPAEPPAATATAASPKAR